MNAKAGLFFLVLMLGMSGVMAATACTPSSGMEWCYEDYSNDYAGVSCHAIAQGTYPKCEGEVRGNDCIGDWYIDINGGEDSLYLYRGVETWSGFWDNVAKCNSDGCEGREYAGGQNHRVYLPEENGDIPGYALTGFDYDEASDGAWCFQATAGGYAVDTFGLSVVDCFNGEELCVSGNLGVCENDAWVPKGKVVGKCGVGCVADSDCGDDELVNTICSGGEIRDNIIESVCFGGQCADSGRTDVKEVCAYGCMDDLSPRCKDAPDDPVDPNDPDDPVDPDDPDDPSFTIATPLIIGIAVFVLLLVVGGIYFISRKK